jgi:hypothetical protein
MGWYPKVLGRNPARLLQLAVQGQNARAATAPQLLLKQELLAPVLIGQKANLTLFLERFKR